jgi:hypothetical protein
MLQYLFSHKSSENVVLKFHSNFVSLMLPVEHLLIHRSVAEMFASLFYSYASYVDPVQHQPSFEAIYARDGEDGTGIRATFIKPPGFRLHQVFKVMVECCMADSHEFPIALFSRDRVVIFELVHTHCILHTAQRSVYLACRGLCL